MLLVKSQRSYNPTMGSLAERQQVSVQAEAASCCIQTQ